MSWPNKFEKTKNINFIENELFLTLFFSVNFNSFINKKTVSGAGNGFFLN